jgi:hypothetical protein
MLADLMFPYFIAYRTLLWYSLIQSLKLWIKNRSTFLILAFFIVLGVIFGFIFQSTEILIAISFSIFGMIFSYALSTQSMIKDPAFIDNLRGKAESEMQHRSNDPAFIKKLIDKAEIEMQGSQFPNAERMYAEILKLLFSNDTEYLKKMVIEKLVELYKKSEDEEKYKEYIKILEEIEVPQYIREIQLDLKDVKEMLSKK